MNRIILTIMIFTAIVAGCTEYKMNHCKCDDMPSQEAGTGLIVGTAAQNSENDSLVSAWKTGSGVVTSDENNIFGIVNSDGSPIDFSKYSVLFKRTSGNGSTKFLRDVTKDDNAKKYVYTITNLQCNYFEDYLGTINLVIIPKIEDGYYVEIIEKHAWWIHHKIKKESLMKTCIFKEDSDGSWKLESETKH